MSARLVFVKRSNEEINIFGGQVFADVDGVNVATIGQETVTVEVPAGKHIVKMYKSHEYGSMIGFAENELTVSDGDALVFKYAPPMVVTQPGHITVSNFISYDKIENDVRAAAQIIAQEKRTNDEKIQQQEENMKKNYWGWIILIFVIPAICWLIYELILLDMLF